jgi:hypothetical protein
MNRRGRFVLAILLALPAAGGWHELRAELIDERPYPLLEFFLGHACIQRDLEISTLIETLGRSHERPPVDLLQAYQFVSQGRYACAADRVGQALAHYDAAMAVLGMPCGPPMDIASRVGPATHQSRCAHSNVSASAENPQDQ